MDIEISHGRFIPSCVLRVTRVRPRMSFKDLDATRGPAISLFAILDGKPVGFATFARERAGLRAEIVATVPGSNAAEQLYLAAARFGDVWKSHNQTAMGARMWQRFQRRGLTDETGSVIERSRHHG